MVVGKSKYRLMQSLSRSLLIAGLFFAFFAPQWGFFSLIDSQMFQLGRFLLPASSDNADIYTIKLDDELMLSPDKINKLRHALNKLNKNKAASVSLLLPQLPSLDYKIKETRPDDKKNKTTISEDKLWEPTTGELTKLAWTLNRNNVLVGFAASKTQNSTSIKRNDESYTDYLISLLFTRITQIQSPTAQYNYSIQPYYYSVDNPYAASLLLEDESSNIVPDLSLAIYKQSKRLKEHDWNNSSGIKLGNELIKTDYTASIITQSPNNSKLPRNSISLDALLLLSKNKIKNKLFIFANDERSLALVTNNLNNLLNKTTYHTSAWANWGKKLGFAFVFIYLLVFVTKLQKNTAYLLTVLLLFGTLVFQYGLLLTQSIWLPLISLYVFLIIGHGIMLLKKSMDTKMDSLMLHTHDALLQLANLQFDQGEHDKAASNLLRCSPTTDVLELMYNIGLGFERRRQYDKALNLYSDLTVRNADYKDVKQRLNSLLSISGDSTEISSPLQGAKTLIMPDLGLQLPMLGRYEIERELGRGAMGVVYLGKDPKINRQVAIKTLDYSQFSEAEIKTFKSRFFREAEAAGRLNHSEIVTVFDVGEEDDFAFIAMDYVNGVPLSDFSKTENLLPIQEVYEIIAIAAEALDYAHAQNIIHRDIKPGNIMYDPKTQKIKITDFGIARITDNAHTRTGSFLGSPSYMAPEQMVGSKVDRHADIYALGVTFYQLLTGSLPFKADSIGNLAYVIANEKHKPVRNLRSELPSSATRIINKALQKKAKDRYNTGNEMANAIRRGMPKS